MARSTTMECSCDNGDIADSQIIENFALILVELHVRKQKNISIVEKPLVRGMVMTLLWD
jgi:hypothetical protein